jgi:hypothetical protein
MLNKVLMAASLAALLSVSLAGCKTNVGAELIAARDFVADPKTQAALSQVKQGAVVIICGVSEGASLTSDVIQATAVDPATGKPLSEGAKARITKAGYVAAGSAAACERVGGTVAGTATAKAATPAIAAP